MVSYDSSLIIKFAERLYSQARSIVVSCLILGALIGGAAGFAVGQSTRNSVMTVVGIAVGGLLGFVIGTGRAFAYRLQAQVALCQVQIEMNTRAKGAMSVDVFAKALRSTDAPAGRQEPWVCPKCSMTNVGATFRCAKCNFSLV